MPYVFSTLTGGVKYVQYTQGGADLPLSSAEVTIHGGTNIPSKQLVTPIGVMTEVSDEDISWLKDDELFKLHMANGFLTIRDKPADPEKVASDMHTRDASAPLVDADFKAGEAPVTSTEDKPKNSRRG